MISETSKTLPLNQFTYFSEKIGVVSKWGPPTVTENKLTNGDKGKAFKYSENGQYLDIIEPTRVRVLICDTYEEKLVLEEAAVTQVYFSPLSSYLVTWQRPNKELSFENLKVWSINEGKRVMGWKQRHQLMWPIIQWTADELVAGALLQIGKVSFFTGSNFTNPIQTISTAGLIMFSISPGKAPYKIAVFIPEKGQTPGTVSVYTYPKVDKPSVTKTFYADSVDISWNSTGSAYLLTVSQDVDRTGKSYYGKKGLFFHLSNGNFDMRVTGDSIHDVKWNPNGHEFAVVYADMPDTKISLFNMQCQKIADLAETGEARNTLYYEPKGRILCVGGFGSLNGNMDFFDVTGDQIKKIGNTNAFSSSYHEWCPDGYHFLAGVVAPRMRIDNGIKVFNYNGELLYSEDIPELFKVHWRPVSPDLYPVTPIVAANPRVKKIAPVEAPKPYRHPHFSGASSPPATTTQKFTPTRYVPGSGPHSQRIIPGSTPVGGHPIGGTPIGGTLDGDGAGRGRGKKKKPQGSPAQPHRPTPNLAKSAPKDLSGSQDSEKGTSEFDPEKRKRNVAKKLREIEALKQRVTSGETLNPAQITKIGTEQSLRTELETYSNK